MSELEKSVVWSSMEDANMSSDDKSPVQEENTHMGGRSGVDTGWKRKLGWAQFEKEQSGSDRDEFFSASSDLAETKEKGEMRKSKEGKLLTSTGENRRVPKEHQHEGNEKEEQEEKDERAPSSSQRKEAKENESVGSLAGEGKDGTTLFTIKVDSDELFMSSGSEVEARSFFLEKGAAGPEQPPKTNPDFVFISETKRAASKLDSIFHNMGCTGTIGVDAINQSGGLFLAYFATNLGVKIVDCTKNFIFCKLVDGDLSYFDYFLYGDPNLEGRGEVWETLKKLLNANLGPTILLGDFN
ncbi:GMP synthase [glutamine-hydrolyzing] [Bienertia sinuspersici]